MHSSPKIRAPKCGSGGKGEPVHGCYATAMRIFMTKSVTRQSEIWRKGCTDNEVMDFAGAKQFLCLYSKRCSLVNDILPILS